MLRSLALCGALFSLAAGCSSAPGAAAAGSDAGEAGATAQEIEIDEGTFTVQPGQEVVYCVRIPMPPAFRGRDLALTGWDSNIIAPMHHYFMFYDTTPTSGTEPVPCEPTPDGGVPGEVPVASAGLNLFSMGVIIFVAGTGTDSYRSNPGYGAVLQSNGTFVTNHHVINPTAQPITVGGTFKLQVVDAASIAHPTQALSCQTIDISLPAMGATDVTATCLAPYDLDVVTMSSHAHQDLVTFETQMYDGTQTQPTVLYTSSQWESPVVQQLTPPLHLMAGQGLTFTCRYMNATDATIGFGLGSTQEMCASMNQYAYPVNKPNQVPPALGVSVTSNATPATLGNTAGSLIPLF
ncbi:MAG: hypothetical protein ACLP1X_05695 [Polyangiaceae bacterium]